MALINPCKILTKECVVRWSYRKFKTEFKDNAIFNFWDCKVISNIIIVINAVAVKVTRGLGTVLRWEGLFAGQGGAAAGVSIFTAVLTICATLALEQNIRSWNNTSTWAVFWLLFFKAGVALYQSKWTTAPLALGTFAARHVRWAVKAGITLNTSSFFHVVAEFFERHHWSLMKKEGTH